MYSFHLGMGSHNKETKHDLTKFLPCIGLSKSKVESWDLPSNKTSAMFCWSSRKFQSFGHGRGFFYVSAMFRKNLATTLSVS